MFKSGPNNRMNHLVTFSLAGNVTYRYLGSQVSSGLRNQSVADT